MSERPLAIVTGGSSGIGYAVCRKLSAQGYQVINADKHKAEKEHEHIRHVKCDIRLDEDVAGLREIISASVRPQVLVLNAGRGIHQKLREGDPAEWADIINLNLTGNLRVLRAVLPYMQKGHVIFVSSVSAGTTYPYGGIYAASKSALESIAETLRLEEQPDIKVGVIRAGVVDTRFFESIVSGTQTVESIGWGAVKPEEVARAIMFMLEQKEQTALNSITIRPAPQSL